MPPPPHRRHSPLRHDVGLTYANALVWAVGNGLVSTTLVVYLALDLGAGGLAVAWLLAAPRFAGVLRLAAPGVLAWGARLGWGRKPMGLAAFAASGVVLTLVPLVAWNGSSGEGGGRVALLAAAWCVYHLLEYLGGVALWSWLGDLYPPRLRSRLVGGRERWLTLGRVVGIGASIAAAALWRMVLPSGPSWAPLAASASVGTLLMLASLAPLLLVRPLADRPSATPHSPWRALRQTLSDRRYRRLLEYSCWFGFANGVSGAAQGMYPKAIGVSFDLEQAYRLAMWAGQSAVAPACGREVDRAGARRVLVPAQLVVALGPLCYFFATPESAWLIGVAYVLWIAYAPLNVALDTLKLQLADPRNNTPYLAAYYAASDVTNGLTMLLGGLLYDTLKVGDAPAMQVYGAMFLAGWLCRTLAAGLAMRIEDDRGAP